MEKIYEKLQDKIIVKDVNDFNIKHILECGQIFRYKREKTLEQKDVVYAYKVFSLDKTALIIQTNCNAKIITKDVDYFINFFDLNTNYSQIKQQLQNDKVLKEAINYGYGIRILKQNFFEMLISFIISANNRIPRIQKSIEMICEKFGTKENDYYAFPTLNQLLLANESDFRECGVGFRDKYLVSSIRMFKNFDLSFFLAQSEQTKQQILQTFCGVGPKVADCILLFGSYDMNVFPVDTWIKKVYNTFYNTTNIPSSNILKIREFFYNTFSNLSGYAQQYLFYYKRELDINKKN